MYKSPFAKISSAIFLFNFCIILLANCQQRTVTDANKLFVVSGKVTQTFSYCGGAKPPQKLIESLATPVAYPGKKFYVREGKINNANAKIVLSFQTDSSGQFSIQLPPGIYSIIQEEQLNNIKPGYYNKQNQKADDKCLQEWWVKPYYLLEIKDKNLQELAFTFHHRCYINDDIPCIIYTGPQHP